MQNLLESSIFPAGTKIIVSKKFKHNDISPFSIGFTSCVESYEKYCPNVVTIRIIVIRKGKRGKQRLDLMSVLTDIFPVGNLAQIEDLIQLRKKHGFRDGAFIYFERMPIPYTNIFDMTPIEFFGWGLAHVGWLAYLYDARHVGRSWPEKQNNPINRMNNIVSKFKMEPEATMEAYSADDFRRDFVKQMRKMESSINRAVLMERLANVKKELEAVSHLLYTNILNKHKLYDMDTLINTYNRCSERCIELNETITRLDNNRNVNYFDWVANRGKKYDLAAGRPSTKKKQPSPAKKEYTAPIEIGDLIKELEKFSQQEISINHFRDIIFPIPTIELVKKLKKKEGKIQLKSYYTSDTTSTY